MKRKVWSLVTAVALVLTSAFILSGCSKKNAEFEAMKKGKFYMDCTMTSEEMAGLEIPFKMSVDGKNTAYSMSFMGMEMSAINKDGKSMELDMMGKTYTVTDSAEATESPVDFMAGADKLTKSTKGKGNIKGEELEYEQFSETDEATESLRYYYKDNKFYALEMVSEGKSQVILLIKEFKAEPLSTMFNIPEGFKEKK